MGRIGYGFGYPFRNSNPFAGVADFYLDYAAYLERAVLDSAIAQPFQYCLFARYSLFLQPTRNVDFINFDAFNTRCDFDGAIDAELSSYVCKRAS